MIPAQKLPEPGNFKGSLEDQIDNLMEYEIFNEDDRKTLKQQILQMDKKVRLTPYNFVNARKFERIPELQNSIMTSYEELIALQNEYINYLLSLVKSDVRISPHNYDNITRELVEKMGTEQSTEEKVDYKQIFQTRSRETPTIVPGAEAPLW